MSRDEPTIPENIINKTPKWAIGFAVVFCSLLFTIGYVAKDTGLNAPLIKLIEAQTNASTDLTKEVKGLTDTVKVLIERVDKNQGEYADLKQKTQTRVDIIDQRLSKVEGLIYHTSPQGDKP